MHGPLNVKLAFLSECVSATSINKIRDVNSKGVL